MGYGLTNRAEHVVRFDARIDLLAPVGRGTGSAGLFVAAGKRTYWLGGADPGAWNQAIAFGHGAVPGSMAVVTGHVLGFETASLVAFWLARNGQFVVGLPEIGRAHV